MKLHLQISLNASIGFEIIVFTFSIQKPKRPKFTFVYKGQRQPMVIVYCKLQWAGIPNATYQVPL